MNDFIKELITSKNPSGIVTMLRLAIGIVLFTSAIGVVLDNPEFQRFRQCAQLMLCLRERNEVSQVQRSGGDMDWQQYCDWLRANGQSITARGIEQCG